MPCGSGARTEDSRLLQMAAPAGSTQQAQLGGIGASTGQLHHQGRFHVSHATLAYHVEAAAAAVAAAAAGTSNHQHDEAVRAAASAAAWDHQCQELHSAVGILDSLPWCRGGGGGGRHHLSLGGPQAAVAAAAAFQAMPELAEEAHLEAAAAEAAAEAAAASSASAAASAAAVAGSAEAEAAEAAEEDVAEDGGCTLTAQLGKSISQVRMSASSSNFPSLDCRCCCDDGDLSGPWESRSPQPPAPSAAAAAAAVAKSGSAAASHLEPPWSNNSCCRSLSQRPSSPASLWQLAACHRSEQVGPTVTRSASFRRRTSAAGHHQQPHHQGVTSGGGGAADCCDPLLEEQQRHVTYQEYLDQLRDRVQLWLLGTTAACGGCAGDDEEEEEEEEKLEEGAADDGVYCYHDNWTPDD